MLRIISHQNTIRIFKFSASSVDEEELCEYTFDPSEVTLRPEDTVEVAVEVKPKDRRNQPFFGMGRQIRFRIQVKEKDLGLTSENFPLKFEPKEGLLTWRARPFWQQLILIMLALLLLCGAALLIWQLFFTPTPIPKVNEFDADSLGYQVNPKIRYNPIKVHWKIANWQQLKSLTLITETENSGSNIDPIIYDFSNGVPENLTIQGVCDGKDGDLACQSVLTRVNNSAGNYTFSLLLESKDGTSIEPKKSSRVTFKPAPLAAPRITTFLVNGTPNITKCTLILSSPDQLVEPIKLRWKVSGEKLSVVFQEGGASLAVKPIDSRSILPSKIQGNVVYTLTATNPAFQSGINQKILFMIETIIKPQPASIPSTSSVPSTATTTTVPLPLPKPLLTCQ